MATPKKPTWNASLYATHRPAYPSKLFDQILEFHRQKGGQFDHALDLGCGTGQASKYLRGLFKRVTCVDPGATMIESAKKALVGDYESRSNSKGQHDTTYTFCVSPAEDLHQAVPEDGTVDLVIAATSCHWFDMTKVWPEIRRILRKGGTAAFWSYVECLLPAFPSTERLIKEYGGFEEYVTASTNFLDTIGQYYPRPQKTRAERFLVDIPSPEEVLGPQSGEGCLVDFERRYFTGPYPIPQRKTNELEDPAERKVYPVIMSLTWTWLQLLGHIRTWSAHNAYQEQHPDDLNAPEDTRFLEEDLDAIRGTSYDESFIRGGDVSIRFWKNLREAAARDIAVSSSKGGNGEVDGGVKLLDKITVDFPMPLLLVGKS